jgi:hypothetical protein
MASMDEKVETLGHGRTPGVRAKRALWALAAVLLAVGACKKNEAASASGGGGGGCVAKFQACCNAVSSQPNMSGMTAACSAVANYNQMGAAGEQACSQAYSAFRQGISAMPGGAPSACAP